MQYSPKTGSKPAVLSFEILQSRLSSVIVNVMLGTGSSTEESDEEKEIITSSSFSRISSSIAVRVTDGNCPRPNVIRVADISKSARRKYFENTLNLDPGCSSS